MKKVRLKLLAIAFVLPMLFVSCSDDEPVPTPPGAETPDVPTPSPESPIKPIVFETKSMYWQTEYDALKNVYSTLCCHTINKKPIEYIYADDADNPSRLVVKEFSIEKAGEKQTIDISELTRQATESPEGYFNVTIEGVTLKYEQPGKLEVSYDEILDETDAFNGVDQDRYYWITLVGDENEYSTEICIKDIVEQIAGLYPMSFDLSTISYPTDRSYSLNGGKSGADYYVYLPASACQFSIISNDVYNCRHFYLIKFEEKQSEEKYSEVKLESIEENGEFYIKSNEYGVFTHDAEYTLSCEISANTTDKEREFRLLLSPTPTGELKGALTPTNFHIIQSAK